MCGSDRRGGNICEQQAGGATARENQLVDQYI
jgi:hypothetical protein